MGGFFAFGSFGDVFVGGTCPPVCLGDGRPTE
jgi:hypothetical protein